MYESSRFRSRWTCSRQIFAPLAFLTDLRMPGDGTARASSSSSSRSSTRSLVDCTHQRPPLRQHPAPCQGTPSAEAQRQSPAAPRGSPTSAASCGRSLAALWPAPAPPRRAVKDVVFVVLVGQFVHVPNLRPPFGGALPRWLLHEALPGHRALHCTLSQPPPLPQHSGLPGTGVAAWLKKRSRHSDGLRPTFLATLFHNAPGVGGTVDTASSRSARSCPMLGEHHEPRRGHLHPTLNPPLITSRQRRRISPSQASAVPSAHLAAH